PSSRRLTTVPTRRSSDLMGSRTSAARTPDQTNGAWLWASGSGPYLWNAVTLQLIAARAHDRDHDSDRDDRFRSESEGRGGDRDRDRKEHTSELQSRVDLV